MNQRVITQVGEHTSHYVGEGYEYFFASDKQKGRQCKLRCPTETLERFKVEVPHTSGFGISHLQVLQQTPGWWLVCSDQPEHDGVVTQFIARFNRWALRKLTEKVNSPVPADRRRYTIEVKNQVRTGQETRTKVNLIDNRPKPADDTSIAKLADAINSKFGHAHRK